VRVVVRVFLGLLVTSLAVVTSPSGGVHATTEPPPTPPPVTFNEFLPEDRGLGDCISAVPRPGCGSEARGGWHQTLVFLAIMLGLAVIVWRIVAASRRARTTAISDRRTPDATSVPADTGGDRAP
jgi:hypothetical protein